MDSDSLLAIARAVHFATCLLAMSICWLEMLVMRRDLRAAAPPWPKIARWLVLTALPLAALSGGAWFALVVMGMSDLPFAQAMNPHILGMVWRDTKFGHLWKWRAVDWIALTLLARFRTRAFARPVFVVLSAFLLASLAWSGHGRYGSKQLHLLAGRLHLLGAAAGAGGVV